MSVQRHGHERTEPGKARSALRSAFYGFSCAGSLNIITRYIRAWRLARIPLPAAQSFAPRKSMRTEERNRHAWISPAGMMTIKKDSTMPPLVSDQVLNLLLSCEEPCASPSI